MLKCPACRLEFVDEKEVCSRCGYVEPKVPLDEMFLQIGLNETLMEKVKEALRKPKSSKETQS